MLDVAEQNAARDLEASQGRESVLEDSLLTNERVIARVTDGIYRQPGSAIRELIANSFDADATVVTVTTDAPRFNRISVEDNGNGMSPATVIHLLRNIGGSSKRTEDGEELGVSGADPTVSPGGRRLIGKLGIGLFSVSQLTHEFQIITKTAGDNFKTVVLVSLRQFSDAPQLEKEEKYRAGTYRVWREPSSTPSSHGTTIVLTAIRAQARRSLQSDQLWRSLEELLQVTDATKSDIVVPRYHVGRLAGGQNSDTLATFRGLEVRALPWLVTQSPDDAFLSMVDSVWEFVLKNPQNARLAAVFDSYLQMLWNLGLALPLPYVEGSLFDETVGDWASFYRLSNNPRGRAEEVTLQEAAGQKVEMLLGVDFDVASQAPTNFDVVVDGVSIKRPIKYRNLPETKHALAKPLVFVGHLREEFEGYSTDFTAGPLEFSAYMFWTPKVAPTEHQGVLVRINGASGTLFDPTFFGYQVSELTRLRQITCEIFVRQGLEAALNIDRESFNSSHPHTVLITNWVHSALRQLATAQKREAQKARLERKVVEVEGVQAHLSVAVQSANEYRSSGEALIPEVVLSSASNDSIGDLVPSELGIRVNHEGLLRRVVPDDKRKPRPVSLSKLKALIQLYAVYGFLDELSEDSRDQLIASTLAVLEADNV